MIKVKRDKQGVIETRIKGGALDIIEELLNATVSIVEMLVEKGKLPKKYINEFIDDFAQQVKDNMKINNLITT